MLCGFSSFARCARSCGSVISVSWYCFSGFILLGGHSTGAGACGKGLSVGAEFFEKSFVSAQLLAWTWVLPANTVCVVGPLLLAGSFTAYPRDKGGERSRREASPLFFSAGLPITDVARVWVFGDPSGAALLYRLKMVFFL